ncbi:shufflon system plasmid conjugative transfer pilus tip adhesin PilV [Shigella sonnei]|uniref:shufflon system plasmid conjugative transfer pilus tip adhesin PilV n=1 Tax=Shigella sonnei TaxID=624 RepID=UPI00092D6771
MSFKLLQHRPQVGAFLEQQLPVQLERTAVAGASCSPNGLVGRDNTGAILSCQSGTWRKVGSGELQIATAQATGWRFPGATATCPTGKNCRCWRIMFA